MARFKVPLILEQLAQKNQQQYKKIIMSRLKKYIPHPKLKT